MKTKFYWVALLASAALIAQAKAGGHHGGGGGSFAGPGPVRSGTVSSFRSMPTQNFGGGRVTYPSQRLSSVGPRAPIPTAFRQPYFNWNRDPSPRQVTPGNITHSNDARFSNSGNRAITNSRRQGTGAGQVRNANNLPGNWQNHVIARHTANWRRDWDRGRDHNWHGHHCRFINGSWIIFDSGFYPWSTYWYPYDYYGYPYNYGPSFYGGFDEGYYDDQGGVGQDSDPVAAAQERLTEQANYRGEVDGILGPETRRAIARYQRNNGLRLIGRLTPDTLQALELPRVASY